MSARITSALIAGAMLVIGICAWAQMVAPDTVPAVAPAMGASVAPAVAPAEAPAVAPAMATAMTCQQMMDQEKPLVAQMTDSTQMARAQKHMSMAQTDLDAGRMHRCENQMKKVMKLTTGDQTP